MTVRHIVTWKMNGETAEERATQANEVVAALRPLQQLVPDITALEAHVNEYNAENNWDVTLMTEHTDKAALDAYIVNPDHVAAAKVIAARAAARAGVDFEV